MKKTAIWIKLFRVTDIIRELHDLRSVKDRPPLKSTLAEMKVLSCVLFNPEGCSVKEIAGRLGITCGAVSQIVGRLVRKGPLIRVTDPNDRRAVRITLSQEGRERHKRLNASFEKLVREMLRGVPEEKIAVFIEVLDHLIASKNEISQYAPPVTADGITKIRRRRNTPQEIRRNWYSQPKKEQTE